MPKQDLYLLPESKFKSTTWGAPNSKNSQRVLWGYQEYKNTDASQSEPFAYLQERKTTINIQCGPTELLSTFLGRITSEYSKS